MGGLACVSPHFSLCLWHSGETCLARPCWEQSIKKRHCNGSCNGATHKGQYWDQRCRGDVGTDTPSLVSHFNFRTSVSWALRPPCLGSQYMYRRVIENLERGKRRKPYPTHPRCGLHWRRFILRFFHWRVHRHLMSYFAHKFPPLCRSILHQPLQHFSFFLSG